MASTFAQICLAANGAGMLRSLRVYSSTEFEKTRGIPFCGICDNFVKQVCQAFVLQDSGDEN